MHAAMSQPIPIASSSKVQQDARSTPRNSFASYFSGSPCTFKAGSFNHRYFATGCSPAQPLGPLALPDFSLKSMLSSSIETEHDHLVRSLNGDVMSMQEDMCRNYTCCGLLLQDLHALVEHFEDTHVVVLDSPAVFPTGGAGIDMDDMEMDDPAPSPAAAPTSAFDTTSVLARQRGGPMFSPYPTPPRARPSELPAIQTGCVTPALLFSPSASPSPLNTPAASRGGSPEPHSASASDSAPEVSRPKPFRCPKPGCNKSYKQANGLKYHVTHGQCNFAPRDPQVDDLKPYVCQVGTGCSKRFKNMSGLRYHYQHSSEHGAIGLAMLQAGHAAVH